MAHCDRWGKLLLPCCASFTIQNGKNKKLKVIDAPTMLQVMELGGNAITCNVHDKAKKQGKDGQDGLQTFSFKSIYDATSNFSTENKLGEGGFGPVYMVSSSHLSVS